MNENTEIISQNCVKPVYVCVFVLRALFYMHILSVDAVSQSVFWVLSSGLSPSAGEDTAHATNLERYEVENMELWSQLLMEDTNVHRFFLFCVEWITNKKKGEQFN